MSKNLFASLILALSFLFTPSFAEDKPKAPAKTEKPAKAEPVELNTATEAQLKDLPAVGDVYAKKIIDGRPYTKKDQLISKKIVSQATYDKIKELVSAEFLDINTATEAQLKGLPAIGDAYAKKIVDGRPYAKKDQLVSKKIIPQAAYDKIKDAIIAKQPDKPAAKK